MTTSIDEPICRVMACGKTRAEHVELNHEFNLEGSLVPKAKKPEARRVMLGNPTVAHNTSMMFRLVHTLAKKGLLDDNDVAFITGPPDSGPRDHPTDRSSGGSS